MPIELPLDTMSAAEKVALIETIWSSLCQQPTDFQSPDWHGELLEERRRRLASGETTVSSWEDVKARLMKLGQ